MDRARSGQKTCYRSWDVASGMSGTGGNNGREQKRVGETRPATARSTSLEKNIEAEATRFFRFATCQHVIWENVIQKDLEETTKRHPKKTTRTNRHARLASLSFSLMYKVCVSNDLIRLIKFLIASKKIK